MRIPKFLKNEKTDAAWEFRVPDRQRTASRLEAALDEKEPLEPTKEVTVAGGGGRGGGGGIRMIWKVWQAALIP